MSRLLRQILPAAALAVIVACLLSTSNPALAGQADIVSVQASQQSDGAWRFSVTVRHDDEGWDHYANRWDVVGPDGTVYGERVLAHPHVSEQPFTRSLTGVDIPDNIRQVTIWGNDSIHGLGGVEMTVDLPK